jgi:hypothetical protein
MEHSGRGAMLTIFAFLFVVLAISNLLKPFHIDPSAGLVFFGVKTAGLANAILGPLFGIFLIVYAAGIWRLRRWALPVAYVYAAYVILNMILFSVRNAGAPNPPSALFAITALVVGVGVPMTTAILLSRRKAQLV